MSEIEWKDIFAIRIAGNKLVHPACIPDDVEFTEDDVVMNDDADKETVYFCDICRKRIV